MHYRKLGNSDLTIPVVSFGAWAIGGWMWGGTDDHSAVKAIHQAIDEGMTLIDTAPSYGMGHSERIVGKAIADRRDKVLIATKCGIRWDLDTDKPGFETTTNEGKRVKVVRHLRPDSIRHEIDLSLERLGIDCIDLYQCHWPDPDTPIADTMEALLEIQAAGKIRAIGVSNFTVDMMKECLAKGSIVSDQPQYNPLQRGIEKDIVPFCIEQNIGILAYSPIAQGLMTGKVTMDRGFKPGDARSDRPWFQPQNRERVLAMLKRIEPIAEGHGISLTELAIAWVVAQPGITSAIVGARTAEQVIENARAGSVILTEANIAAIRAEVEALGEPL